MAKQETSSGIIIFYIDNNEPFFLLLKYPTYWGFPKGRIEKQQNETEEQTAKREVREETGLIINKFIHGFKEKQNWYFTATENGKKEIIRKTCTYFLAKISKEEKEKVKISSEHEGYVFIPLKEAKNYINIKQNFLLLKKARTIITKKGFSN